MLSANSAAGVSYDVYQCRKSKNKTKSNAKLRPRCFYKQMLEKSFTASRSHSMIQFVQCVLFSVCLSVHGQE